MTSRRSNVLTFVDVATFYGMVAAVTEEEPGNWAWESLTTLGSLSLLHSRIRVLRPFSERHAPKGVLTDLQTYMTTRRRISRDHPPAASSTVTSLMNDRAGVRLVQNELSRLASDQEFNLWCTWHIHNEWPEHIERLGGLIDGRFLNEVAIVINAPTLELHKLNRAAKAHPKEFSHRPSVLAQKAYAADVLLRAIYYDELSRLEGHQITFHPVRRGILRTAGVEVGSAIAIPRPIGYLLQIVTHEARKQRKSGDKVHKWMSDVSVCRDYLKSVPVADDTAMSDDKAIDAATRVAVENRISPTFRAARKRIDKELRLLCHLIAWKVSPYVGHWLAHTDEVIHWLREVPIQSVVNYEERGHYKKLAREGPGRVLINVRNVR